MNPDPAQTRRRRVPNPSSSFIGRQEELSGVLARLRDPGCRLLTLVGSGGMGKTRLAIEAARLVEGFPDGVVFVDLSPVTGRQGLLAATADALGVPLSGQEPPDAQLCSFLQERELLLVLDNFENILEEATLLAGWLGQAPALTLLITSRLTLNLREEWLFPVAGLRFPSPAATPADQLAQQQADFSSIRLFTDRAQRVRPGFSAEAEAAHVARICYLVEGMPLAIELAASWTRTLSCADIAAEIDTGIELLATGLRDAPQRQSSIQVIFDNAWERLTAEEQRVLQEFAVFPADFSLHSATAVTRVTPKVMASLVGQSLLQPVPGGRYHMHGLLRQYAQARLDQAPELLRQARQRHADHFVRFLGDKFQDLLGDRQPQAMADLEPELEHLRVAHAWSVHQRDVPAIRHYVMPYALYLEFRSRYLEAADVLEACRATVQSPEAGDEAALLLAEILVELAWIYLRFGRLADADMTARQALENYQRVSAPPQPGHSTDPLAVLGVSAAIRGDYEAALALGERSLAQSHAPDHLHNRQLAHYVLAGAALARGDYHLAQQHARLMEATLARTGDRWMAAYCHIMLGDIAVALGNSAEATAHFEAGLSLRQEFDDAEGMAVALLRLGQVAREEGQFDQALNYYERSFAYYQTISDRGGLAGALHGLGQMATAREDYNAARRHFQKSLRLAVDIEYMSLIPTLLVSIAEWLAAVGKAERGLALLAQVTHSPTSPQATRTDAERMLEQIAGSASPDAWNTADVQSQEADLASVLETLLVELAIPLPEALPTSSRAEPPGSPHLAEQLTPREHEVLLLIADGLTNVQIADRLVISVGTVKFYTSQIYGKLQVASRTQAVARARKLHILD